MRDEDDNGLERVVVLGVVRGAGVAGAFLTPDGLVTDDLDVAEVGLVAMDLAGVGGVALVDGVLEEANDILLGFADRPSFISSLAGAFPSVELNDERWAGLGVLAAAVLGGFRMLD